MTTEQTDRFPAVDTTRLTAAELRAWTLSAELANALAELPHVHPQELAEAVTHLHALQTSILARCAYPEASRRGVVERVGEWLPGVH